MTTNKLKIDLKNIGLLLIGIFCQISSLFPNQLIAIYIGLLIVLFLLCIKNNRLKGIKFSDSIKWYGLFFIFVIFSLIYTINTINPNYVIIRMAVIFVLICLLNGFIDKQNFKHDGFFKGIIIGGILGTAYVLFKQSNLIGKERLGANLYGSYVEFGNMISITLYALIWYLRESKKKFMYIALILFFFFAAFLSGGRKAILMPLIFLVLVEFFSKDSSGMKKIAKFLLITILIGIIIYFLLNNSFLYSIVGKRINELIETVFQNSNNDKSYIERISFKNLAKELFANKPILGYGVHGYAYMNYLRSGNLVYSHDNFLEMLSCFGIVGFSLFYYIYLKFFYVLLKMRSMIKKYKLLIFFISFMILTIVMDLYTISYLSQSTMIFVALSIEYLNCIRKEKKNGENI